jgi:hypothetical protein
MTVRRASPVTLAEYAQAGKGVQVPVIACDDCECRLRLWGGYWRSVRHLADVYSIWIPRRRCSACRRTHAVLPDFVLDHRRDTVDVIGRAVEQKIQGTTAKATGEELGVPATTVRDWLRRHRERAPALIRGLTAWLAGHDPSVRWTPTDVDRDAVTVLGAAWQTAHRRFNGRVGQPWEFWNVITGGAALGTNTSPLFPRIPCEREMAVATPWRPP